jgi:nucleoid-associated protein YgaU
MSSDDDGQKRRDSLAEYAKFGVFLVVVLGAVLGLALLRPLIFGQVLPAVLGLDTPSNSRIDVPLQEGQEVISEPENSGVGGEPSPWLHTVQEGQSLGQIAVLYDVSVEDIAFANNILNPHNIQPGTLLIIPRPE